MDKVFEMVLIPLLTAVVAFLIYWINIKIQEIKGKTNNETANKYLDFLNETIVDCINCTNQTYVDSLKEQGAFGKEEQKIAFNKTFEAVKSILTEDGKKYLGELIGDIEVYIRNRIESSIKIESSIGEDSI